MTEQLRFDNQVAIVTGGGGALGAEYCKQLASRGAAVVVNDQGVNLFGKKQDNESAAEKVVKEIIAQGGRAIANHDDICTNSEKIVQDTLKEFGRIDILINNAGVQRDISFMKMTDDDWNTVLNVHLHGTYALTHKVWPHMVQNKYGRIIATTSAAGLYGNFGQANYSSAKLALVAFVKSLAQEGEKYNILINAVSPIAASRMTETVVPADILALLKPSYVAPLVAKLCHQNCNSTGNIFECGGGLMLTVRFQRNQGAFLGSKDVLPTIEDVHNNWDTITSFKNSNELEYPQSAKDSMMAVVTRSSSTSSTSKHDSETKTSTPNTASSTTATTTEKDAVKQNTRVSDTASGLFKSAAIIDVLRDQITEDVVKRAKAIFVFDVTNNEKQNRKWTLDLKNGKGCIQDGIPPNIKPDATLSVSDTDFVRLVYQEVQPQKLFMTGKLKVKGNLAIAMKFEQILRSMEERARGRL